MRMTARLTIVLGLIAGLIPLGIGDHRAQAGAGVRSPSNVCFWYNLSWNELRPAEQRAWASLGWNARLWERGVDPAVGKRAWNELSGGQRSVLASLGYSQAKWDNVKCSGRAH